MKKIAPKYYLHAFALAVILLALMRCASDYS